MQLPSTMKNLTQAEIEAYYYGLYLCWEYKAKDYNQLAVIQAYEKQGLTTDHLIKGQSRIKLVERALQKAKEDNLLSEIENTPEKTRYQFAKGFVEENSNGEKFIDFRVEEFITYDKVNDTVVCDNPDRQELIKKLMQYCSEVFTVADIARYFRALFSKFKMVPIYKGVYFVPIQHMEFIEKLQKVFREIDPKGIFVITEIPKAFHSKETLVTQVESDCSKVIKKIKEELEELQKAKKTLSKKIYTERVKKLVKTMEKMKFYENSLQIEFAETRKLSGEVEKFATDYYLTKEFKVDESEKVDYTDEELNAMADDDDE